mmetsp:Transcript_47564/g.136773  ORF Transcript_47564/g.136773 Transcript_47564/m.136773 type:complete len:244 (-) Transcript_47564:74-805(-)
MAPPKSLHIRPARATSCPKDGLFFFFCCCWSLSVVCMRFNLIRSVMRFPESVHQIELCLLIGTILALEEMLEARLATAAGGMPPNAKHDVCDSDRSERCLPTSVMSERCLPAAIRPMGPPKMSCLSARDSRLANGPLGDEKEGPAAVAVPFAGSFGDSVGDRTRSSDGLQATTNALLDTPAAGHESPPGTRRSRARSSSKRSCDSRSSWLKAERKSLSCSRSTASMPPPCDNIARQIACARRN